MTTELIYTLERKIVICAKRTTVFRYFTESKRFADWWGEGSTIDGRIGGKILIRHPGGNLSSGEVLEFVPPEKIVFTYGYESGTPIPPGGSRVTVLLQEHPDGTELYLKHELADEKSRDEHIQGWRYQLSVFANVAALDQHSNVVEQIDAYFDIWNTVDGNSRRRTMEVVLHDEVTFHDRFSCTSGMDDMNDHLNAMHHFMPGLKLSRHGEPKFCQGTALARWNAFKTDGSPAGAGMNVFDFAPDGKIRRVKGFWD